MEGEFLYPNIKIIFFFGILQGRKSLFIINGSDEIYQSKDEVPDELNEIISIKKLTNTLSIDEKLNENINFEINHPFGFTTPCFERIFSDFYESSFLVATNHLLNNSVISLNISGRFRILEEIILSENIKHKVGLFVKDKKRFMKIFNHEKIIEVLPC